MDDKLLMMLAKTPLQQYIRVLNYYDDVLNALVSKIGEIDDEENTITNDLIDEMSKISLSDRLDLKDRVLQLVLGSDYKDKLESVIITSGAGNIPLIKSTAGSVYVK